MDWVCAECIEGSPRPKAAERIETVQATREVRKDDGSPRPKAAERIETLTF